jgi:predicted transcriptional regulator|tara:strand:- start:667 stop:888 length:222 start_codon:yes stop_codon:yes gene_type:complete
MKKREQDKKNKKEEKRMNEMYEMIKQFVETQIEVNKFRIKHFQEFEENLDSDEDVVSVADKASFSKKFEEEWA